MVGFCVLKWIIVASTIAIHQELYRLANLVISVVPEVFLNRCPTILDYLSLTASLCTMDEMAVRSSLSWGQRE